MTFASQEVNRLLGIDSLKVFLTFRHSFSNQSDWIKEFRNLYNHLDFIDGHLKEVARVYENYRRSAYDRLLKFKGIVDHIPDVMAERSVEIRKEVKEYKDDSAYKFLQESIVRYRTLADGKAKIERYNPDFLEPVLTECVNKFETAIFGPQIIDGCKKVRVLLNDVIIDSGGHSKFDKPKSSTVEGIS